MDNENAQYTQPHLSLFLVELKPINDLLHWSMDRQLIIS